MNSIMLLYLIFFFFHLRPLILFSLRLKKKNQYESCLKAMPVFSYCLYQQYNLDYMNSPRVGIFLSRLLPCRDRSPVHQNSTLLGDFICHQAQLD